MHWSRGYLGLPYQARGRSRDGIDCWGLPCMVYVERLGIVLPSYAGDYVSAAERDEAEALFRGEFASGAWVAVQHGDEREYDLAWFRSAAHGGATHVGIVLRPGLMLHASEGDQTVTCTERYDSGAWWRLLIGFERHRGMEARHNEA